MFSLSSAPAKQSVSETITVLSGRLSSATLLEDRRAAILGLRSFAKDYPASVASGALRSLIGCLSKDGEDVDTIKVVLETLLMLFSPNEDSPEASDEIALWLADEFTQRQENITLLLGLLEASDFYSRLYTLQLLSSILGARTERTEECIFTAPMGISTLVSLLDERREAIRDEAVGLLIYLTPSSADIQKLVAFENAFERLFAIIEADGSLSEGGRTVEDCLCLLANLLRENPTNQSLFRESKCIAHLSSLLERVSKAEAQEGLAHWAQTQRSRNIYALLSVVRLFLTPGSVGLAQNQGAYWHSGLLYHALQLAFSHAAEGQIRAEALTVCADVIRGNADLQGKFAQLTVTSPLPVDPASPPGKENDANLVYVIDGLLYLILELHSPSEFNLRLAGCECLKAYLYHHSEIRLHFLSRAIEGHKSGSDETSNVLTTLLHPSAELLANDPYALWFAAVITLHLLYENPAAKANAMAVTEGDVESGEEVVTSIQTVTAHLISGLTSGDDPRVLVAYLMLLLGWLFEDPDGVNDFLGEGSNVQSLIQAIVQPLGADEMVQGLCAMLLGVAYEFSTKDSPIPRETLQSILLSRMGRGRYLERLTRLRNNPSMRDYEVIPQRLDPSGQQRLPDVFFDGTFVEFFKDNYSRVVRAIDREPDMEVAILVNGAEMGVSRELVDSLRDQVEGGQQALQSLEVTLESLRAQVQQEQEGSRRVRDAAAAEVAKLKAASEALQREHENALQRSKSEAQAKDDQVRTLLDKLRQKHDEELRQARTDQKRLEDDFKRQVDQVRHQAETDAERIRRRSEAEVADLKATISRLEVDILKANKSKAHELQAAREESQRTLADQSRATEKAETKAKELDTSIQALKASIQALETSVREEADKRAKAEKSLAGVTEARDSVQSELDDLLMVLAHSEDKVKEYRERLIALGEEVSDGDDDDDSDDDDDDEEDEDDDEAVNSGKE